MLNHTWRRAPLVVAIASAISAPTSAAMLEESLSAINVRTLEDPTYNQSFNGYDVAVLPDGGFAVVWAEQFSRGYGVEENWPDAVQLQRFDEYAQPVGETLTLYETEAAAGSLAMSAPSLAADATGDLVVAWTTQGHFCEDDLFVQRIDGDVVSDADLPAPIPVTTDVCEPDIAVDADGDFAVVWKTGNRSALRTFSADGSALSSRIYLTNGSSDSPTVAISPEGTILAGWSSGYLVYGHRYSLDGTPLGDEFRLDTDRELQDSSTVMDEPSVAADTEGGFVALWNQLQPNISTSEDVRTIRAQRWHADGTPGAALQYGDSAPDRYTHDVEVSAASLGVNERGEAAAVWFRDPDEKVPEFKITAFDGDNAIIENETQFVPGSELSTDTTVRKPRIATGYGTTVMIWAQREPDQPYELNAQSYKDPSDPNPPEDGGGFVESSSGGGGALGPLASLLMMLAGFWRWLLRR
jgi:hypothetical protein